MAVYIPKGSQVLVFPMYDCTVAAGFKNKKYTRYYGYIHYGVDFDSQRSVDFDVLASGTGTVLGVEKNSNSIGGVVVVKYPNVYIPSKKKVDTLIIRYLHLYSIAVKKGDTVSKYSVLGTISGSHKYWNHIHLEIDTDTRYPFHTPQVSENSSRLLIRRGATDSTMLDPMKVLVVGNRQKAEVHELAIYASHTADKPRYYERDFIVRT